LEPGEAVEDEIEGELEFGVVVAPAEGAAVGDREGHLHAVTHMLEHHASGKIAITA
jgi:hypothetical protein